MWWSVSDWIHHSTLQYIIVDRTVQQPHKGRCTVYGRKDLALANSMHCFRCGSHLEGFESLLPKDLAGIVFREHIRRSPSRAHYTDESSNDTNIRIT